MLRQNLVKPEFFFCSKNRREVNYLQETAKLRTISEVAKEFNVTRRTVYDWMKEITKQTGHTFDERMLSGFYKGRRRKVIAINEKEFQYFKKHCYENE